MRNKAIAALSLFIFILFAPITAQEKKQQGRHYQEKSQKDFYEHGNALLAKGKWEHALKTWWEGFNALESEGLADPRIGVAFIELATEMKAEKYYGTACVLYLKSLSSHGFKDHRTVVIHEFLAISPFLELKEYENLKLGLASEDVSKIANRINQFWQGKDPTPATPGNERLISHWLRIADAKRNFAGNRSSVYATDDRGVVYIAYGEPARTVSGHFETRVEKYDLKEIFSDFKEHLQISKSHTDAQYEIWIYSRANSGDSVIFMFRKDQSTASYTIVSSVQDFVPDFRYDKRDDLLLLTMYYRQLAMINPFFESRFLGIKKLWTEPSFDKLDSKYKPRERDLWGIRESDEPLYSRDMARREWNMRAGERAQKKPATSKK